MQTILAELGLLLAGFVERDLPGVLVVACNDIETLYLAQALEHLDERSESDVFLTFADPARSASAFVDAVVANLALQQAGLAEQLESVMTLPELPAVIHDAGGAPVSRITALIEHVLRLLPAGDHRLVFALCPSELPPDFAAELAAPLLRAELDPRVRLVLRDDRTRPTHFALATACPEEHVLAYSLVLAPEDALTATIAAARDPERPAEARIQALMELAFLDLGHGHLDEAEQKFRGCAEFHTQTRSAPLEALALAGVGDVQRARGDLAAARQTYERALLTAAATQAFPVTLQIATALADTCLARAQHGDAEGYYRLADALAARLLRPHTRADLQESMGVCALARGAGIEAERLWHAAAELCRAVDYPQRLHSLLGRLADYYDCKDRRRMRACREEQANVHARLQEGHPC